MVVLKFLGPSSGMWGSVIPMFICVYFIEQYVLYIGKKINILTTIFKVYYKLY